MLVCILDPNIERGNALFGSKLTVKGKRREARGACHGHPSHSYAASNLYDSSPGISGIREYGQQTPNWELSAQSNNNRYNIAWPIF